MQVCGVYLHFVHHSFRLKVKSALLFSDRTEHSCSTMKVSRIHRLIQPLTYPPERFYLLRLTRAPLVKRDKRNGCPYFARFAPLGRLQAASRPCLRELTLMAAGLLQSREHVTDVSQTCPRRFRCGLGVRVEEAGLRHCHRETQVGRLGVCLFFWFFSARRTYWQT